MSEYPTQPRPQGGWPSQPPRYTDGQQGGYQQGGYLQNGYRQDSFGHPGIGEEGYSDYGPRAPVSPRRRRRGRGWIGLLVTLVVLAVLFVIGDQVAKAYAENMIAGKIQTSASLTAKPTVTIEGFPFLTQVASHDVRTIDIDASDIRSGRLVISSVKATATGVHLNSGFNGATIDHISGTALVTFAALVNATGAQGVAITAAPSDGPNAANVSVGPLSATAQVIQTAPDKITIKMKSLGGIAASAIGQLPDYTFTVPPLPVGLRLQAVTVTNQGIDIKVAARNTTLSQ